MSHFRPASACNNSMDKPQTIEMHEHVTAERGMPAPGDNGSPEKRRIKDLKNHKKAFFYSLAVMTAILLYGYDFVIVGSVASLNAFQADFGAYIGGELLVPSLWLALWKAGSPIGATLGSLLGGKIADRFGRRFALFGGVLVATIGIAVFLTCHLPPAILGRRLVFLFAKIVQGTGIGMLLVFSQTYLSEAIPAKASPSAMALLPLFTLLGQLIGAGVITSQSGKTTDIAYLAPLASQFAFTLLPLTIAFFLPESPVWLLRKGRRREAWSSLEKTHPERTDLHFIIEETERSIEMEQARESSASLYQLFQGTELRRTVIVMIAYAAPQLWGLTLLADASYFLQVVGLGELMSLVFLILGILLGLVANIVSFWTIVRFPRRSLILFGLTVSVLLWTSMGIANCFNGEARNWYTAAALMMIVVVNGLTLWPAYYVVGAEVSSLRLRALSQSLGWSWGSLTTAVFSIILPYIYNPGDGNIRGMVGFVYAGFCGILLLLSWVLVPETKGRRPRQIDRMFELCISPRKSSTWKEEGEGR